MLRIITYLYTYRVSMHISSLIYPLESPYIISVYSEIAIRLLSFSSEVSAPKSQLRSPGAHEDADFDSPYILLFTSSLSPYHLNKY